MNKTKNRSFFFHYIFLSPSFLIQLYINLVSKPTLVLGAFSHCGEVEKGRRELQVSKYLVLSSDTKLTKSI